MALAPLPRSLAASQPRSAPHDCSPTPTLAINYPSPSELVLCHPDTAGFFYDLSSGPARPAFYRCKSSPRRLPPSCVPLQARYDNTALVPPVL
ncbi:hypothetical protein N7509_010274 [Penicillium cosmopolitanum]|uniref:Uncharacterized protein n=1 Tax=Penicillium cosmopolitanum TaxID=1131564 RepID=A0A9W9VR09_9EURO|nr:uncharacterized protein N7509_010274 [Penicillium cosmopolitanum]KAJ5387733.1 hypothetical protein N7509_010274 [Penicillium cosmopolitanum]